MFKRTIAALTAACLVGLGVIGLSTSATATENDTPEICYGEAPWIEPTYGPAPLITPEVAGHEETFRTEYTRHSWNPQGPVDESTADPTWPTPAQGKWTANTHEGYDGQALGVPYQVGGGNEGDNASWFVWTGEEVSNNDYVEHQDAVYGERPLLVAGHYGDAPVVPCPPVEEDDDYVTVAWRMPSWSGTGATWPQTYQDHEGTDEPALNALDDDLANIPGCYQIDVYNDNEVTTALIAGGHLDGPGNPPESLISGGEGTAWKFLQVGEGDCNPPTVIAWPFPQSNDVCGPDNAEWVLPTGDDRISWVVDAGRLIGTITAEGFTWPNGTLENSWGAAPDSGDICPPTCEDPDVHVWHTWTGGPIGSDEGPAADAEGWNANSGNPQSENHAFENHTAGVPYFVSHGNSGKGDWFLWTVEDCPPPPVEIGLASASWDTTPPTCDDLNGAGSLLRDHATLVGATLNGEEYTNLADFASAVHNDPAPSGSDWTLTFQADPGYLFADGSSELVVEFHVPAYKTLDDWDCRGDKPHKVVDKTDECVEPGFRSYTITVTRYVWDYETHSWVLGEPEVVKSWTKADASCNVLTPALFDFPTAAPTCTDAEQFDGGFFPYEGENFVLTVDRDYDGPGVYTLTATANPGYSFEGEGDPTVRTKDVELVGALGFQSEDPDGDCFVPIVVTPQNPTVVDACGPNNLVITLPANTAEITYTKDGNVVTATAAEGFVFQDGEDFYPLWEWTFTDSNTPCPVPASNPLPPTTTVVHTVSHLAATGSEGALALTGIAALLLVAGAGATALARRRQQV